MTTTDLQRIEIHFAEGISDDSWLILDGSRIKIRRGYEVGSAIEKLIKLHYAIVSPGTFIARSREAYYVRMVDTVAAPGIES